ncbi:hypothetical protein GQ600_27089 [Phytophthora cactorum]|nr:hypothetical protein GQ600_27089 [Phytophthora cactorum]
MQCTTRSTG